jgi:Rrf2 family iron-sulfur cluster assembly transcriptional regulator
MAAALRIRRRPGQHWSASGVELNTKGRYAVTAMAELAQAADGAALALSTIADRQMISLAYLEQIFLKLRRAGLVDSARGRTGGYRLARPASDIRIADIMNAVEEDMRMTRCGAEAATCLPGRRCITHGLWNALSDHIEGFLLTVTLQQVVDGAPIGTPTPAAPARPLASAAE